MLLTYSGLRVIASFLGSPQPLGTDGENVPELNSLPNCFQLINRRFVPAVNSVVKQTHGRPHQVNLLY
jgi:hypothetical protein